MILPLLVFIVVLILVFISFKRENFNSITTTSIVDTSIVDTSIVDTSIVEKLFKLIENKASMEEIINEYKRILIVIVNNEKMNIEGSYTPDEKTRILEIIKKIFILGINTGAREILEKSEGMSTYPSYVDNEITKLENELIKLGIINEKDFDELFLMFEGLIGKEYDKLNLLFDDNIKVLLPTIVKKRSKQSKYEGKINIRFILDRNVVDKSPIIKNHLINSIKVGLVNAFLLDDFLFDIRLIDSTQYAPSIRVSGLDLVTSSVTSFVTDSSTESTTGSVTPTGSVTSTGASLNGEQYTEVVILLSKKISDDKILKGIEELQKGLFNGIGIITLTPSSNNEGIPGGVLDPYAYKLIEYIEDSLSTTSLNQTKDKLFKYGYLEYSKPQSTMPVGKQDNKLSIEQILSKRACIHTKDKCNIGFKPYSNLVLETKNPKTKKTYTDDEKTSIKKRLSERCENEKDTKEQFCCDPLDTKLDKINSFIPKEVKRKFKNIVVDTCNNKIKSIKVCNTKTKNCNPIEDRSREATSYELCKLQTIKEEDINDKGIVDINKLKPDCFEGRCEHASKLLEIQPDNERENQTITDHYYLVDAVKSNNVSYIKSYFNDRDHSVNEKLEYGYPGNTILHQAIFDKMDDIVEYLITLNVNMSLVNKDGNSALHIACLKGNYNATHKLIKLGASVNCTNEMKDTSLHCAVRSGSYNTVQILLNNGATATIDANNDHKETPLHVAVVSRKKNLKIVQVLVEYGAEIHSFNKYSKSIMKSLMEQKKTIVRETIRTFLQRTYYNKYSDEDYNKMLSDYPEIRPFDIDTDVPKHLEEDYQDYKDRINYKELIKYEDEFSSNRGLYLDKETKVLKAGIDSKYFDDNKVVEKADKPDFQKYNDGIVENFSGNTKSNKNNVTKNTTKSISLTKMNNVDTRIMGISLVSLLILVIATIIIYLRR